MKRVNLYILLFCITFLLCSCAGGQDLQENSGEEQQDIPSAESVMNELSGCWTSVSIGAPHQAQVMFLDHTIEFYPDGTFSADLGEEITGSLDFDSKFTYLDDKTIDSKTDNPGVSSIWMTLNEDQSLELIYGDENGNEIWSVFRKMNTFQRAKLEKQIEPAKALVVGKWTSVNILECHPSYEGDVTSTDSTEFTMTLAEDGSFTGTLYPWFQKTPLTCRWELSGIDSTEDGTVYRYVLQADDYSASDYIIYIDRDGLHVYCPGYGGPYSIVTYKRTEEK